MMPDGAQVVSVQLQDGIICVWAIVETDYMPQPHEFSIFGTGQPLPEAFNPNRLAERHLASVQQGPFVWHVFGGVQVKPGAGRAL